MTFTQEHSTGGMRNSPGLRRQKQQSVYCATHKVLMEASGTFTAVASQRTYSPYKGRLGLTLLRCRYICMLRCSVRNSPPYVHNTMFTPCQSSSMNVIPRTLHLNRSNDFTSVSPGIFSEVRFIP